jgi:hypothetical protein
MRGIFRRELRVLKLWFSQSTVQSNLSFLASLVWTAISQRDWKVGEMLRSADHWENQSITLKTSRKSLLASVLYLVIKPETSEATSKTQCLLDNSKSSKPSL